MPSAEYQREWRVKNPEKQKEYNRKQYNKDIEGNNERNREYHNKNRDRLHLQKREYYYKNKEHLTLKRKEWAQTPKGKSCIRRRDINKRARRKEAEGFFTVEDIKDLYATQGGRCYYCSIEIETGYHIEHMTPLSRGGSNWIDNICLACAPCNLSKHTKTAKEFMACLV